MGLWMSFLFWCRHPLVPLLFHEVTSLHPLHFREMIFPLVKSSVQEVKQHRLANSPSFWPCLPNKVTNRPEVSYAKTQSLISDTYTYLSTIWRPDGWFSFPSLFWPNTRMNWPMVSSTCTLIITPLSYMFPAVSNLTSRGALNSHLPSPYDPVNWTKFKLRSNTWMQWLSLSHTYTYCHRVYSTWYQSLPPSCCPYQHIWSVHHC